MKTLFTTTIISVATLFAGVAQADVSTRYQFVAADRATESSICVVAAQNGYAAARTQAYKKGLEVKQLECNGKTVASFSRQYINVAKVELANASF